MRNWRRQCTLLCRLYRVISRCDYDQLRALKPVLGVAHPLWRSKELPTRQSLHDLPPVGWRHRPWVSSSLGNDCRRGPYQRLAIGQPACGTFGGSLCNNSGHSSSTSSRISSETSERRSVSSRNLCSRSKSSCTMMWSEIIRGASVRFGFDAFTFSVPLFTLFGWRMSAHIFSPHEETSEDTAQFQRRAAALHAQHGRRDNAIGSGETCAALTEPTK
jgi:hypothetical protein